MWEQLCLLSLFFVCDTHGKTSGAQICLVKCRITWILLQCATSHVRAENVKLVIPWEGTAWLLTGSCQSFFQSHLSESLNMIISKGILEWQKDHYWSVYSEHVPRWVIHALCCTLVRENIHAEIKHPLFVGMKLLISWCQFLYLQGLLLVLI